MRNICAWALMLLVVMMAGCATRPSQQVPVAGNLSPSTDDPAVLRAYIRENPNSPTVQDVKHRLATVTWNELNASSPQPEAWVGYVNEFGLGENVPSKIASNPLHADYGVYHRNLYSALGRAQNVALIDAYVNKYPSSPYANDCRKFLSSVRGAGKQPSSSDSVSFNNSDLAGLPPLPQPICPLIAKQQLKRGK